MILDTFTHFPGFELIDSGNGYRLERWGGTNIETGVILQRPDPQVIWPRSQPAELWDSAWAIFKPGSDEEHGKWEINKYPPKPWIANFENARFLLKMSPFKHTGLFAEQAAQWEWILGKITNYKLQITKTAHGSSEIRDKRLKILNLFGYTGGATIVLAQAGCQVTHVDASKPAITWANENHKLNKLSEDSVRWILDDAVKFVQRELKRGTKYDGIIMDPPAFGHSPTGKTWKFNRDLPGLLTDCVQLLSSSPAFLVINGYATNSSAISLNNILEDASQSLGGNIEYGELCLKQKNARLISTGIFARWS